MKKYMEEKINNLKINGIYRQEKEIDKLNIEINLSSNDYMSMSKNPVLKQKAIEAIELYGIGCPSSRLVSGNLSIHKEIEKLISLTKKTEDTILVGSGYIANTGVLSAICNRDFVIFSDKLNHASIVDGAILSRAKLVRYKHGDYKDLGNKVSMYQDIKKVIITDGVFSMDGDIAPINEIYEIAVNTGSMLIIDDAHGFGVLGEKGGGTLEYLGLRGKNILQVGTLSKAVGVYGGFITGDKQVIEYLRNYLRGFIYSTALPPTVVYPSIESIKLLSNMVEERKVLKNNSNYLRKELRNMNLDVLGYDTPIIPVVLKDEEKVMNISSKLLDKGVYVPGIRVPTVPKNEARLRISLNREISREIINKFLEIFKEVL